MSVISCLDAPAIATEDCMDNPDVIFDLAICSSFALINVFDAENDVSWFWAPSPDTCR